MQAAVRFCVVRDGWADYQSIILHTMILYVPHPTFDRPFDELIETY
jgi:hypothetical protein